MNPEVYRAAARPAPPTADGRALRPGMPGAPKFAQLLQAEALRQSFAGWGSAFGGSGGNTGAGFSPWGLAGMSGMTGSGMAGLQGLGMGLPGMGLPGMGLGGASGAGGGAGLPAMLAGMMGLGGLPAQLSPAVRDALLPAAFTGVPHAAQPPAPTIPTSAATTPPVAASSAPSASGAITDDVPFAGLIREAAARYSVPPALLAAVMKSESGFNPRAHSPAGAMGLMQLMPGTAAGLGVDDPWDPAQNVDGGAHYLSNALSRYNGDVRMVLQHYNAGPGAVAKYNGDVPYEETRRYVRNVMAAYERFQPNFA